jgi:hypothetical protein
MTKKQGKESNIKMIQNNIKKCLIVILKLYV